MTATGIRLERAVFVETSAFFAVLNGNDAQHQRAADASVALLDARRPFVPTNIVVAETHALVLSRIGQVVARRVLVARSGGELWIVPVTGPDAEAARQIIARSTDKSFSYAGAMSFAVMDRLGRRGALTLDRHFAP